MAKVSAKQRLAAAVQSSKRANWFALLPKAKQRTVEEYVAALRDTPGASVAMVHRLLSADGVVTCSLNSFKEHLRGQANG